MLSYSNRPGHAANTFHVVSRLPYQLVDTKLHCLLTEHNAWEQLAQSHHHHHHHHHHQIMLIITRFTGSVEKNYILQNFQTNY